MLLALPGLLAAGFEMLRVVHTLQPFGQDVHPTQMAGLVQPLKALNCA